jgi:hypothetical protein
MGQKMGYPLDNPLDSPEGEARPQLTVFGCDTPITNRRQLQLRDSPSLAHQSQVLGCSYGPENGRSAR